MNETDLNSIKIICKECTGTAYYTDPIIYVFKCKSEHTTTWSDPEDFDRIKKTYNFLTEYLK